MPERERLDACEVWADQLPEVAFAVREPADTPGLSGHLDRCAACRHELAGLAATADRLALLAPEVDPPAGFEARVLEALVPTAVPDVGRQQVPAAEPPSTVATIAGRGRSFRWLAAAAAAVVLLVAAFVAGRSSGPERHVPSSSASAVLESDDGESIGGVHFVTGRRSTLTVWLDRARPGVPYGCVLVMPDGARRDVGWWTGADGERSWTVDLEAEDLGAHRVERGHGRLEHLDTLPESCDLGLELVDTPREPGCGADRADEGSSGGVGRHGRRC